MVLYEFYVKTLLACIVLEGRDTMRLSGLILGIISIVIAFFNYNIAILIFGSAMLLFGINYLKSKNKTMAYIYLVSGLVFIIGISIKGFSI
jgi:hypothetical protein